MTREEAMKVIRKMLAVTDLTVRGNMTGKMVEACQVAIEALQTEPCEGTVGAIMHILTELGYGDEENGADTEYMSALCDVAEKVKALPPVTQKQKTGHWITKIKSNLRGDIWPTNPKCSECGGEPYFSKTIYSYNFCPYCGEKMEGCE